MTALCVCGFLNLSKSDPSINEFRSVRTYLSLGQKVLNISIPKIVFLDESVIPLLSINPKYNTIVKFKFEEMYLYQFYNDIINNCTSPSPYPKKDTKNYIMVQNQKTMWIEKAISLFPEYTHYYWLDFGIFHLSENDSEFSNAIENLHYRIHKTDRITIPGCWDHKKYPVSEKDLIHRDMSFWYFCGGLVAGPKDKLLIFNDLVKFKLQQLLKKKRLTFDVTVWKLLYDEYPDLFEWYYGIHGLPMFLEFKP